MDRAIDIKRRAQRCIQSGDLDGALAEYEKLIAADESDPYNYVLIADLLYKKGNQDTASKRYLAAATAYEKAGLYKNAIAVGKKMLRLGLSPATVLDRLANLHSLDGLATEATLYYQQYAEHQVRVGRNKEAAEALRKAFDSCPDNIKALERLAEVHSLLEDQRAVALTYAEASAAYARAGKSAEAEKLRLRAEQTLPGSVAAFESQGPPPPQVPAAPAAPAAVRAPRRVEPAPEPGVVQPGGRPTVPGAVEGPAESVIAMEPVAQGPDADLETDRPPVFVPPQASSVRELDLDRPVQPGRPTLARDDVPAEATASAAAPAAGDDAATGMNGDGPQLPDSVEAVERLLALAQTEFRAGNRESAAQLLVRAAQAYEALGRADNAASIYRSLCKGPHGTTAMVELWFANCERRDDRREGATVACDLGDRAIQDNDVESAREWFERALRLDPNNGVASRRLERLAAGAPVAPAPAPPREAPPVEAPPEPQAASEAAEEGKVEVAIGRSQAVTFDFSAMLAEFQRGVETQLSGDAQAHYDLAVAYREMGLVQQAIESFRLAAQDPRFKQRCAEMIGHCLLEEGRFDDAVQELGDALADPTLAPESAVGIRFDLGLALEAGGRNEEALAEFEHVFAIQASYPDVAQKIRNLKKSLEAA